MWYTGFALGLLSSAHCAGMCGPLHMALAAQRKASNRFLLGRLTFNLGRAATYTLLGLLVGSVGALGRLAFPQQVISIAAGVLMLVLAIRPFFQSGRHATGTSGAGMIAGLKNILFTWMNRKSLTGQALTGALNGLLPCGTLYVALAATMAMPTAIQSVGFMLAFGLGTLPLLFTLSVAGQSFPSLTRRFPQVQLALPVLIAGLFLIRGVTPLLQDQPACHSPQTAAMSGLMNPAPGHDILCSKK